MKAINEIFLSWLIKCGEILRPVLIGGGVVAFFLFFARAGYLYGSDTNQPPLQTLLIASGLALLTLIVLLCFHFYNAPEIVRHLGGTIVGLSVGGMIVGVGAGGHWDMPTKMFGLATGAIMAVAPLVSSKIRQKGR
jgi:hypothetical protein